MTTKWKGSYLNPISSKPIIWKNPSLLIDRVLGNIKELFLISD